MEQRGGGDVCEDGYIGRTDCEKGSTGSTNADKLRSLPDEEIEAVFIGCPGTEFGGVSCYEIDPDAEQHEIDCVTCTKNWLKAPYTGWNNEKKS